MTEHEQQSPPAAEIILSASASQGLVAIPVGEKYQWADTALRLTAGFERHETGIHTLRDITALQAVMPKLLRTARRHRAVVTAGTRPYIGDYATALAARLPGTWTANVEICAHPVWQGDWLPLLWDSGELVQAVEHRRVTCMAVLDNGTGTELLLIERPDHAEGHLLGAFASSTFDDSYENVFAPRSVVLVASPERAASLVAGQFLPAYERAVHARLLDAVEAGHTGIEQVRTARSDARQDALVRLDGQDVKDPANLFWRLRPHAAQLLDRTRASVAPGHPDTAALGRLHSLLNPPGYAARSSVLRVPPPPAPVTADDVRRWRADATVLLHHARLAMPPGPSAGASPVLVAPLRALPAPPASPPRGR
ncbi:hypothetical protein SLA_7149 [Streptomyces laurentii]|uniref:Uncharacterized protein n=1 Tax=Streptomyces laurentii TaxID=39478 RepID=A0A160P9I7_STRLU|nr:hypothetical protein SLA_7149 [Streptomyces laurentii]